tara:strand:- start:214 stop:444 length:231 start_codon:yes stop_codon:yes gene_type:complete
MDKTLEIKTIISNEVFLEEIKDMINECLDSIKHSNPHDVKDREVAYMRLKAIESMMTRLESVADSDKIKDKSWTIL